MEQDQGLLRDGRLLLSDVALSCGFADQSHFTHVFTKLTDLTHGA
ncbi:AraC family transcriptional regulator [Bradyrhizobium sp. RT9a]